MENFSSSTTMTQSTVAMSLWPSDLISAFWNEEPDPRTKDWFLVSSNWQLSLIIFSYLYFVLKCGPEFMKTRKPYDLKSFIWYYNLFQILSNAWIVYTFLECGLFTTISLICGSSERLPTGQSMQIPTTFFWLLLLKVFDLIETMVFVLRKKDRQISFLHLYHHVSTIVVTVISLKYFPTAPTIFPAAVNSFVHVLMYTYYLLSTNGPKMQAFLAPIKPYITTMQMVQFILLIMYAVQGCTSRCPVGNWFAAGLLANLFMNFALFANFYKQNYKEKPKTR